MKRLLLLALVLGTVAVDAQAKRAAAPDSPKWKEECGSCHVAYPARFLTAEDWQRLMGGLDKHFGDNAAIDPQVNREILDYLKRYAGSGARHSAPSLRISETPWFTRAHREVPARAWTHPEVKSRANCTACHINAERGDWSERGVRMPGGLREEEGEDDDD